MPCGKLAPTKFAKLEGFVVTRVSDIPKKGYMPCSDLLYNHFVNRRRGEEVLAIISGVLLSERLEQRKDQYGQMIDYYADYIRVCIDMRDHPEEDYHEFRLLE